MPRKDYVRLARGYDFFLEAALTELRKTVVEACGEIDVPKVLEVACGTGSQARYFSRAGMDYRGIDVSEKMLSVASAKGMNCMQADGTALPFGDGEFDVTTVSLALHEAPEAVRQGIFAEMLRVTRADGALVVADYAALPRKNPAALFNYAVMFAVERFVGGEHYRNYREFMRAGGIVAFVEAAGAPVERARYIYSGAMGVITARKT